ncbi:S-adenosylhomocysteine deaminase Methylthioadenosine deaminase [Edwardsiella anguillarum]|uniref:amidohydrolase family protein n=1 Tax=Edwardsiella TaxID=635 RepID=UPI00045CBE67|nr:amidohydrolase family protein [Edwardsiella anguillarum]GAJ67725.1 guanine deaminase [Edwardsiella piscicida]RFS99606.1 amidohydrolase [Edwardsiella anguillarum]WHP81216.1 amidohydrolase family protein [Edwardsiella anguillarum]WHQ13138.1 amidohydrolase family protein [Edwardsiella anguillarum]WHQ18717.1 amidohydrolase family protein [Edwardsiella anguillarum]
MKRKTLFKGIKYLDSVTMLLISGDIYIVDGIIIETGKNISVSNDVTVIESEHLIAFPGLVNAHIHPSKEIYGSILDASPIDIVLDSVHRNNKIETPEGQYIAALKALTSGIQKGVTTFGLFTSRADDDIKAAKFIGCRCVVNFCQSNTWVGKGHSPQNSSVETALDKFDSALSLYQDLLISITPATASELSADDQLLLELHQIAKKNNTRFILHVHEGKIQVELHIHKYGKSGIQRLADLNILDQSTTLVHCCHLSEKDISLLKEAQSNIIHCPVSNSFVGAGTLPLAELMNNLNIGLGTDAAMVNPGNNLTFDAMFALYHHGDADFNKKITATKALHFLTEGGAKTLGLDNVGKIKSNYKADLIFFEKSKIDTDYINTPVSLLKLLNNENPSYVLIDGNEIIIDGQFAKNSTIENDAKFKTLRERVKL